MAALVQQRLHIVVRARSIHKDKGTADDVVAERVAAGRLVLAAVQVEQLLRAHRLEILPELWVNVAEDGAGLRLQLLDGPVRTQRGLPRRVNIDIPGAQRR